MHYLILTKGLVAGMNFFQRETFGALLDLRDGQYTAEEKKVYFKDKVYQDIDDYIIYMFKLFQATQARMVQGMNTSINIKLTTSLYFKAAQVTVILLVMGVWILNRRK